MTFHKNFVEIFFYKFEQILLLFLLKNVSEHMDASCVIKCVEKSEKNTSETARERNKIFPFA